VPELGNGASSVVDELLEGISEHPVHMRKTTVGGKLIKVNLVQSLGWLTISVKPKM